jgi:molecular chaperone HtpG
MTDAVAVAAVRFEGRQQPKQKKLSENIVIGKDILELVSGAMYVEPLTIVREYIQNAVDATDEAEAAGLYAGKDKPRIEVVVDLGERRLRIRDNGIGVDNANFAKRLTAFGASKKRGTRARGFRGVGRLSGLGYCQELIFRSRSNGDPQVIELSWDGRRFKDILLDPNYKGDLNDVVREVTSITSFSGTGYPKHFFDVELRSLVRHKTDDLLNEQIIERYLAQVAPVPFHPEFDFGPEINRFLGKYGLGRSYEIFIGTTAKPEPELDPIFRTYRNDFTVFAGKKDGFSSVNFWTLPGGDGEVAAVGWILDHSYYGAIPRSEGIKGLRLRSGNIQVGSDEIMAEIFPEPRFNSWMVGEIHIVSQKLIPNGRRDAFEANAHFANLESHVAAQARTIAKTCRDKSKRRNFERRLELEKEKIYEKLTMISRRSLPHTIKNKLRREVTLHIKILDKLILSIGDDVLREKFEHMLRRIKGRVGKNIDEGVLRDPLARFSKPKREMYRQVIGLIFESAPRNVAGPLVEKLLAKLSR